MQRSSIRRHDGRTAFRPCCRISPVSYLGLFPVAARGEPGANSKRSAPFPRGSCSTAPPATQRLASAAAAHQVNPSDLAVGQIPTRGGWRRIRLICQCFRRPMSILVLAKDAWCWRGLDWFIFVVEKQRPPRDPEIHTPRCTTRCVVKKRSGLERGLTTRLHRASPNPRKIACRAVDVVHYHAFGLSLAQQSQHCAEDRPATFRGGLFLLEPLDYVDFIARGELLDRCSLRFQRYPVAVS
jgi:hypothetical protein